MSVANAIRFTNDQYNKFFDLQMKSFEPYREQINTIVENLADEESRQCFIKEFAYRIERILNPKLASAIVSPFDITDMQSSLVKLTEYLKINKISLTVAPGKEDDLAKVLISTFINHQYHYKDIVTMTKEDVVVEITDGYGDGIAFAQEQKARSVYVVACDSGNKEILEKNAQAYSVEESHILSIDMQTQDVDTVLQNHGIEPTFLVFNTNSSLQTLKNGYTAIAHYKPKLVFTLDDKIESMILFPMTLIQSLPEYKVYCRKTNLDSNFTFYAK